MKSIARLALGAMLLRSVVPEARTAEMVPYKMPAKLQDAAEVLTPSAIQIHGFLGKRLEANATNRLRAVQEEPMLAGFRQKPGAHPWIGEHVGKWLHAATLAWAYNGDPELRAKLDRVAAELIRSQEADGYLGTYTPETRFGLFPNADWDVWSHKYNLIGLLTYYQFTASTPALEACRKMGDLLYRTFPARKSILAAGTHVGMAATSVLEPMVLLYRFTGEPRYLEFARYLVTAWDEPNGPAIIQALLNRKAVNKTANAKAYEMLSNLVGLCELARVAGERTLLEPVLIAWEDVVARRLYVTGSASQGEHFRDDHDLPNQAAAHVAETCVTTTWIQLNLQLLRLTGQARFGDELERTVYNHLAAAQLPRGDDWCYFTPLEGKKAYLSDINCCHSSGPRGMALAPLHAYLKVRLEGHDGLAVSTFESSEARMELDGQMVPLEQRSQFPRAGTSRLILHPTKAATFGIQVRTPGWAAPLSVQVNGRNVTTDVRDGWTVLPARRWQEGDIVELKWNLVPRAIPGDHGNAGRMALGWGPFILAYDESRNPGLPRARSAGWAAAAGEPPFLLQGEEGLAFGAKVRSRQRPAGDIATLVTFAEAGSTGGSYAVWLRAPGTDLPGNESLLQEGTESRSRRGNQGGSIIDGDPESFVVTFDGKASPEDWYAVTLETAVTLRRVVFAHGRNFHDGGWFDTSTGKPKVQVQQAAGGSWETVGLLEDYPATTATDGSTLKTGQPFTLRFRKPVSAAAVRVVGKPASGDNPRQAFSSCSEITAHAD